MSRTYKIHTSQSLPLVAMIGKMTVLQMFRHLYGRFCHPTYYCYNFSSLRGVDVTADDGFIEIRTTVLSNHHDHQMAGFMIKHLSELTGGTITNDEDEEVFPYFADGNIYDWIEKDLDAVYSFLQQEEELSIFGPFGAYELNNSEVLAILEKKEHAHSKMFRLEKLLKQPYNEYFERIRQG